MIAHCRSLDDGTVFRGGRWSTAAFEFFMETTSMSSLTTLRNTVKGSLLERDSEVDQMILGYLSGQHVFFCGVPGTAKSMLADNFSAAISGMTSFSTLMHKFTPPEETQGPLKLSELKNDKYERATLGYLPEAEWAFLDEIWKSSPAILNTLLWLLNERKFRNGNVINKTPLRSVVAASNEYPVGESFATTGALYDRFLIRSEVREVSQGGWHDLVFREFPKVSSVITRQEMDVHAANVPLMKWSLEADKAYMEIAAAIFKEGIKFGNRRLRLSAQVCQASAVMEGHSTVEVSDLEPLKWTLWVHPDQQTEVAKLVTKIANPGGQEVLEIMSDCEELFASCANSELKTVKTYEALQKIQISRDKLLAMKDNEQAKAACNVINLRLTKLSHEVYGLQPTS